eukprot:403350783
MKRRNQETKLPLNRIKKIMQTNKEIGKIQSSTPMFIAKALELFIEDITKLSADCALHNNDSKIQPSHIKSVVERNEKFGFLRGSVDKVADLVLIEPKQEEKIEAKSTQKSKRGAAASNLISASQSGGSIKASSSGLGKSVSENIVSSTPASISGVKRKDKQARKEQAVSDSIIKISSSVNAKEPSGGKKPAQATNKRKRNE